VSGKDTTAQGTPPPSTVDADDPGTSMSAESSGGTAGVASTTPAHPDLGGAR
jgi:hypothetical protein